MNYPRQSQKWTNFFELFFGDGVAASRQSAALQNFQMAVFGRDAALMFGETCA